MSPFTLDSRRSVQAARGVLFVLCVWGFVGLGEFCAAQLVEKPDLDCDTILRMEQSQFLEGLVVNSLTISRSLDVSWECPRAELQNHDDSFSSLELLDILAQSVLRTVDDRLQV